MSLFWKWWVARKFGLPRPQEFDAPPFTYLIRANSGSHILAGCGELAVSYRGESDQVILVRPTGVIEIIDSDGGKWYIKAVNS